MFSKPATRIRVTRKIQNGYPVEEEGPAETICAAIIPMSGRDLDRLPHGMRDRETVWIFTSVPLSNGDDGPEGRQPDLIEYKPHHDEAPRRYRVYRCEDWGVHSTARHIRSIGFRVLNDERP